MNTILIVDDEEDSRLIIDNILNMDYEILFASSGTEALNILNSNKVDLILLDIMMPDINGYEVCKKIRANESTYNLPIILISALSTLEDRLKGFNVGANNYISKPIIPDELKARVYIELENYKHSNETNPIANQVESKEGIYDYLLLLIDASNQYNQSLLKLESADKILEQLIHLIKKINCNGYISVDISKKNKNICTKKSNNSFIKLIIDKAKEHHKSMLYKDNIIINESMITALITDLPSHESIKQQLFESLKLNFQNTALVLSKLFDSKPVSSPSPQVSSYNNHHEMIERVNSILSMIETQQKLMTDKNQNIIEDLIEQIHELYMHLGLTESQEQQLISLVEAAEQKVISVTQENHEINTKISLARNLLKL